MKKKTLLLVQLVVMALFGCSASGGSSSDDSTAGTTSTISETDSNTAGEASSQTAGAADAVDTDTTAATGGHSQGNNPGTVPSPVLGEVSDLDVSSFSSPAGYKVYAGDAIDPDSPPDFERFVEHAYLNLEFPCNGGVFGNFEAYPAAMFGDDVAPYAGIFSWAAVDVSQEAGSTVARVVTVTSGDEGNVGNTFSLDGIAYGSLIVGQALFEDLLVSRIVQFEQCG